MSIKVPQFQVSAIKTKTSTSAPQTLSQFEKMLADDFLTTEVDVFKPVQQGTPKNRKPSLSQLAESKGMTVSQLKPQRSPLKVAQKEQKDVSKFSDVTPKQIAPALPKPESRVSLTADKFSRISVDAPVEMTRIPIRELGRRFEEDAVVQDEISKAKARLQKLAEERQQCAADVQRVETQMQKLIETREQKEVVKQLGSQLKQQIQAEIDQKKLKNREFLIEIQKKAIDSKLKVIEDNKRAANEVRATNQLIRTAIQLQSQTAEDEKKNIVKTMKQFQPTWKSRIEKKIETVKRQYYAEQYSTVMEAERRKKEHLKELFELEQQEKNALQEAIAAKEKRVDKIKQLEGLLQ